MLKTISHRRTNQKHACEDYHCGDLTSTLNSNKASEWHSLLQNQALSLNHSTDHMQDPLYRCKKLKQVSQTYLPCATLTSSPLEEEFMAMTSFEAVPRNVITTLLFSISARYEVVLSRDPSSIEKVNLSTQLTLCPSARREVNPSDRC